MLRVFDVRDSQFTVLTVSKLPQGDLGRCDALSVNEINQNVHGFVGAEPYLVCNGSAASAPPLVDRPLNVEYVYVIYWRIWGLQD